MIVKMKIIFFIEYFDQNWFSTFDSLINYQNQKAVKIPLLSAITMPVFLFQKNADMKYLSKYSVIIN